VNDGPNRACGTSQTAWAAVERLEPRALFSAAIAAAMSAGVDLAAQFVNRPLHLATAHAAPRSTGTIKLRLTNTGNTPETQRLNARFYISTNTRLDSTDLPAGTAKRWYVSLQPGGSKIVIGTVVVPGGIDPGSYFLLAAVKESTGQTILVDQPLTLTHARQHQQPNNEDQSCQESAINCVDSGYDTNDSCSPPAPTDNGSTPQPQAPSTATTAPATQPADNTSQPPAAAPTDDGGDDSNAPTEAPDTPDSGDIGDVGDAFC
jgi:hypothetical protein